MSDFGNPPPERGWQPPTSDELHAQLPQYEILEVLGAGGMGAVYKAFQASLERYVALKILPPSFEADPQYAQRFRQEAKIMARLSHPGIVAVYDGGRTSSGLLYIVMEFVEGTDVHQMIQAQGRLPAEQALAITLHVCDALSYAHENGVVHRDIKPANIMVDTQGRVKVADFGLAKNAVTDTGMSTANMTMGTPDYVAPEALVMGMVVDQRADVYSVGVMMYEMLTGKVPRGRFEPASVRVPGLDPRHDAVIDRAMRDDREGRYASVQELKADLVKIHAVPLSQSGLRSAAARVRPGPISRPRASPVTRPEKAALPYGLIAGAFAVIAAGLFLWKPWASSGGGETPTASNAVAAAPPISASADESPAQATPVAQETKTNPGNPESTVKAEAPPVAAPAGLAKEETKAADVTPASPPRAAATEAVPAPAVDPPVPAAKSEIQQRLDELEEKFKAAADAQAEVPYKEAAAVLNKNYYGAVERALDDSIQSGKLDDTLALREELKRPDKNAILPLEADGGSAPLSAPAALKSLRDTYWKTMRRLGENRGKVLVPLFEKYDQALAEIQAELTKATKIDDALRVKSAREEIAQRRERMVESAVAAGVMPSTIVPKQGPAAEANNTLVDALLAGDKPWTGDIVLPPKVYPFQKQIVLGRFDPPDTANAVAANIISLPGTSMESLNLLLKKGSWKADGTLFKQATIAIQFGGEMQARNSLFDACVIKKVGAAGLKYFSVKWTFENCVFSKTFISPWQVYHVGAQATHCTFLDVAFSRITFREDAGREALDPWVTLRNCRFVGCKVPESVVLATKDCVFEDCHFGDPEKDMVIRTPIAVRIYTPQIGSDPPAGPNRKIEMLNSKQLSEPAGATLRYRKVGGALIIE